MSSAILACVFDVEAPHIALETLLFTTAVLLIISVIASKASGRLGVPSLLLFIAVGMLAGSEGPGAIAFDNVPLAQAIGVVALCFILFSGGLDTRWSEVRSMVPTAAALAPAGVLLTALAMTFFARYVLGFSLAEGFLFGAVISSTDAAAVFAVLRARNTPIPARAQALVEVESASNDPMAVFLTAAAIQLLMKPSRFTVASVGFDFVLQMGIGLLVGVAFGRLLVWTMNRLNLEANGLYAVFTIASVLAIYSATVLIHGSGFLSVYVAGLFMGSRRFVQKRTLTRFHDAVAWLMQITMFLVLGLLAFPSQLLTVAWKGLATAFFLMLVARPVAVFLTLLPAGVPPRLIAFIAWAGFRGAVPIILATFPMLARVPRAEEMFNLVFFVVIASVLVQGPTLPLVARLLRLTGESAGQQPSVPRRDSDLVTVIPPPSSPVIGRRIVDLELPEDALVLAIYRRGTFFVPQGSHQIEGGDRLMILTSKRSVDRVREVIEEAST